MRTKESKLFLGQNLFKEISENVLSKNINLSILNISNCPHLIEIKAAASQRKILQKTIVIADNPYLSEIDQNAFNKKNVALILK